MLSSWCFLGDFLSFQINFITKPNKANISKKRHINLFLAHNNIKR
jgi:hypothetical protein